MSRAPAAVQTEMLALAPIGYTREPASRWGDMLLPPAAEGSLIEHTAEAMHAEIDPRSSFYLLPEWGTEFGADPYGVDTSGMSSAQLQAYYYSRLTQRGGQSAAFFIALAAAFGIPISITTCKQTVYGAARYGANVYCETPNQFAWRLTLPQTTVNKPVYGRARFGDDYGTIVPSPIVPILTALAPAHTQVIFSYTGP